MDVDFILQMDPDYYHEARAYPSEFEKRFMMTTQFKTTNMVAFDVDNKIRRFATAGEILETFYNRRLLAYGSRKDHELGRLADEITELEARLTFVRAVVEKRLVIANAEDDVLLAGLRGLELPPLSDKSADSGLKGYEYLLRMRVDRLKASAVAELEKEVAEAKTLRDGLAATSSETLWLNDLDGFSAAWADYIAWRNATYVSVAAGAVVKKKMVRKAKVAKA